VIKYLFLIFCIVAFALQGIRWMTTDIIDGTMWANQARYVATNNPEQFNAATAYGHPGGPLILGTIATQKLTGTSYHTSLLLFLTLISSILIAATCIISFALRRNWWWTITLLGILSLHRLFNEATPPSALVSLLGVLLLFVTWYIYERPQSSRLPILLLWSVVAGAAVATRLDTGSLVTLMCAGILVRALSFKKVLALLVGAFVVFAALDPFMWFMPVQHIVDILDKAIYHYAEFDPIIMKPAAIFDISLLALVSVVFAIYYRIQRRHAEPVPRPVIYALLIFTVVMYSIILTSQIQTARYFQPIIMLWESLLPLFLFSLVPQIHFTFGTIEQQRRVRLLLTSFVALILVAYPASLLFYILL
jgi:hypothetical protein